MRILILDTNYPSFLKSFYEKHPGIESLTYDEHWRTIMDECFSTADFYSSNLEKLGHEAKEVIVNNESLQRQWAVENNLRLSSGWWPPINISRTKKGLRLNRRSNAKRLMEILKAQIQSYSPDVLYVQNVESLPKAFIRDIRSCVHLVVGQHAAPLMKASLFSHYDLIVSSLPNMVNYFREQGLASEYLRLGFEPSVLDKLLKEPESHDVVHIGGYGPVHNERTEFLEKIIRQQINVDCWGYGIENIPPSSPIHQHYHGDAWGLDMYNIRHGSRISINKHITSVADGFCNNLTLYEATGVGALLITDYKDNLPELFEPWREVLPYKGPEECSELIKYHLEHEDERLTIAQAGQERTLREHTYYHRMQELVDILDRYLRKSDRSPTGS